MSTDPFRAICTMWIAMMGVAFVCGVAIGYAIGGTP
jgi:hypothetical protein